MNLATTRGTRRQAPTTTEFDPTTVPVFPVLTVEVLDNELLVNGRIEPIPAGTATTDAAVAAAAAAIARRGLDHCRVSAVVDGTAYPLVVGADGSRHDLSTPARTRGRAATSRTGRTPRAWVLPVAVMVLALVTAGVVVATVHQFRSSTQPTAAVAEPAPSPTELPVLPPDGWSTRATWSVPLASLTRTAVVTHDGIVLAVTADDRLTAHDAATGVALSRGKLDGAFKAGPVLTRVDDQQVVAAVTSRHLYWWPDARNLADVRQVALTSRAQVSFAGSSPLVTLPGQHAATVVAGQLSDRTIPAGAQAIRADGPTVTALDAVGRLWRLSKSEPYVPAPTSALKAPQRGQVPTLLGSTGSYLMVGWRPVAGGTSGSLAIVNLAGQTVATHTTAALRAGDDWVAGSRAAVAAGHAFTASSPRIVPISDTTWRSVRIVNDTIYGTTGGRDSATLDPDSGKVVRQQNPTAAAPLAADTDHAYVAADTPDGPVLYALQHN